MSNLTALSSIIATGIGKKAIGYERLLEGEVNEVYIAHLDDAPDAILRISHNGRGFEVETWAIQQTRLAGVPAPNVLAIGSLEGSDKTIYYSIQEMLPGRGFDTLLWVDGIPPDRVKKITQQAGEMLARIHSAAPAPGYGSMNSPERGQYPDALAWVQAQTSRRDYLISVFEQNELSSDVLGAVLDKIDGAAGLLDPNPRLLHCDYGPKHLFVDEDDNICGVIDFGECGGGDTATDAACWDFWFHKSSPAKYVYEGYERGRPLGDNFKMRLEACRLYLHIDDLEYYTHIAPVPDIAKRIADELRSIISKV